MRANYHTHTPLCMHAEGDMEQFVVAAMENGYDELGFADHCPWSFADGYVSHLRMTPDQFPGYMAEARRLQREYEGRIRVMCGLEVEYYPDMLDWMRDFSAANGVDYLVFGNHYDIDERTGLYFGKCVTAEDLHHFADTTIRGMQTGMFVYAAHPDLCFRRYQVFDDDARAISRDICCCARETGMPLEYNIHGDVKKAAGKVKGIGYPCREFWEIAAQEGVTGIIGVDAHTIEEMADAAAFDKAVDELAGLGITRIESMDKLLR